MNVNLIAKLVILIICFLNVYAQEQEQEDNECPFEGCRCIYNAISNDISIDCIASNANSEFPRRRYILPTNTTSNYTQPKISLLIFYGYNLETVPDNSFSGLYIKYLHLISTNLRKIGENLFNGTEYLEELIIYGASIDTIEKNAFEPVKETLRKLDLSNCNLNSKKMDRLAPNFKSIIFLKTLILAENRLRELKARWFNTFEQLKVINLAKNGIEIIPDDVFKSTKMLRVIDLSSNNLQKFPSTFTQSSFSYKYSLQVIKLNQNQLRVVETFSDLEELLELDLSDNLIEEIDFRSFRKLINLERLNLENNNIRFIENDAFTANTRLRGLFLNNNYLSSLPSLNNLNELATLKVENQNGKLVSLKDYSFDTLSNERYANMVLYLRSNAITSFANKAFCSRNLNYSNIDVVYIDYYAIRNMDKCLLKQLKPKREGYPVYVIIDDESIDQTTDVRKYKDVCNCENIEFGKQNQLKFIGICKFLSLNCESEATKIIDDCDKKPEFQCLA